MNEKTKITLSNKELEMVCNTDWILTKQSIIQKVYQLLGDFSNDIQQQLSGKLPEYIYNVPPKISRGESYQNLPYVMLDYPRYFSKNETTAIRTFFWWGHFCSINLHLSGDCKTAAEPILVEQFFLLQQCDFSICVNDTPWEHHFGLDNFVPAKSISVEEFKNLLKRMPFVKIAKKIPLQEWEKISLFIRQSFNELLVLIQIKRPIGEIDLLPDTPTIDFDL